MNRGGWPEYFFGTEDAAEFEVYYLSDIRSRQREPAGVDTNFTEELFLEAVARAVARRVMSS